MRIVYILTSLGIGGAEKLVLALADHMSARGHTVAILVLRPRLREQLETPLEVVHLDMRKWPLSVIRAISRGRRFLRGFRPDIVHSHGFYGNMMARLFRLLGCAPAPVSTIHNVYEGGWTRMLAYCLTDGLSRLTTAVSAAAAERFVRLKAVPARKCVALANGIDTEEFLPAPARGAKTREQMRASNEFVWLAAGRIVPAKDYSNLLRAFALVRAAEGAVMPIPGPKIGTWGTHLICDTHLWIAGELTDAAEALDLRKVVAELGLQDRIQFLGLRRDIPALLDAAEGFVLASAWEGMPLAVAEAMAMEKAVVATNVGGTGELVGDAGLLVQARDAEALAAAMLRVMRMSAEERRALGHKARSRIAAQFSIGAKAGEWEALYARLIRS
jgi:glycosyltransferase involved in cell wall biosynthesis